MEIRAIQLKSFPPFAYSSVIFPNRAEGSSLAEVHLFVGPNGSGKTRLLCALAAICGDQRQFEERAPNTPAVALTVVGRVKGDAIIWKPGGPNRYYTEGFDFDSNLPFGEGKRGLVSKEVFQEPIRALGFRTSASITDTPLVPMQVVKKDAFSDVLSFGKSAESDKLVSQTLANLLLTSVMESMDEGKPESVAQGLVNRLHSALSAISGRQFRFVVRNMGAVTLRAVWGGEEMKIGQLPDGLRAVIGWLGTCIATLYATSKSEERIFEEPLILLLDEPETNLHPSWQRLLIPSAQIMFPNAQMFIATHSPFIVSSVNEGWIHVFMPTGEGVVINPAEPCGKGDSWLDAAEDVLGVREWYDPETETQLQEFRSLRNGVVHGTVSFEKLAEIGLKIAERSEGLRQMIGKELAQVRHILKQKENKDA